MPSIISHSIVGLAAAALVEKTGVPAARFWALSAICPVLPDADVAGMALGVHYGDVLGHRGFLHSLSFALLSGVAVTTLFFRGAHVLSGQWCLLSGYFFLLTASHGLLDAFTNGGYGVAFFSPFSNKRYFFPWTPIRVSPLGITAFFSSWGLRVISSELIWIWLPSVFLLLLGRFVRHIPAK